MTQALTSQQIVRPRNAVQLIELIHAANEELYRLTNDLEVGEQSDAIAAALSEWRAEIDAADDIENAYDPASEHGLGASQLGIVTGRAA